MSLGYMGMCTLMVEDDNLAIYTYRGEDWNLPEELRAEIEAVEGEFSIEKRCFEKPTIRTRIHRLPNGKKKTEVKKILHTVDWGKYLEGGGIVVFELCGLDGYSSEKGHRPGHILCCLLGHLFREYQETGEIPKTAAFVK